MGGKGISIPSPSPDREMLTFLIFNFLLLPVYSFYSESKTIRSYYKA